MKPSLPLSLLILSLLLSIFHAPSNAQKLIDKICRATSKDNPNINSAFCNTSLQAAPASRCASLQGLGKISLRLIRDNLTDTRCHVRWLKKNKKLDPFMKKRLDDCFELYSDAIPAIKKAGEHFKLERFMDANMEISSVMEGVTTCEDGFKEKKGFVSPLTKKNGDTFELSAIALAVMKIIQNNSSVLEFPFSV